MPKINVKFGSKTLSVDADLNEPPFLLKAQLFELTEVPPERQKLLIKGKTIGNDSWNGIALKDGATIMLLGNTGSTEAHSLSSTGNAESGGSSTKPAKLDEVVLPVGLKNLGNTCYMNATLQCFKVIPELDTAVKKYNPLGDAAGGAVAQRARVITTMLKKLYGDMDRMRTNQNPSADTTPQITPIFFLHSLHQTFPQFATLDERGQFQQQDANECFCEVLRMLIDEVKYSPTQNEAKEVLNAGVHCDEPKKLPEEYRKFVEDPTSKGTVYIAFGTIIQWDYAPPNVLAAFFEAFERLPEYRFIFAFKGKLPKRKLPAHVRLVSWAPQQEILAHPKTKVFLTHCGLKSIKESICSRTPMLAMPIFAEQNHNARMMVALKTGIALNKYAFNTDQLHKGLTELLQNPMYAERIEKLQKIFLDRPIGSLDEGEFYVSKIIEKGESRRGRHFFRRKGAELTSIEHFFIDWTICILFLLIFIAKA